MILRLIGTQDTQGLPSRVPTARQVRSPPGEAVLVVGADPRAALGTVCGPDPPTRRRRRPPAGSRYPRRAGAGAGLWEGRGLPRVTAVVAAGPGRRGRGTGGGGPG